MKSGGWAARHGRMPRQNGRRPAVTLALYNGGMSQAWLERVTSGRRRAEDAQHFASTQTSKSKGEWAA